MRVPGFSLIELLVALVVMALLATVALPLYTRYADQAFRREAQADLLGCSHALEAMASERFSYANAADTDNDGIGDADSGPVAADLCAPTSPDLYRISVSADAVSFSLKATPIGRMAGDGALSFDSAGNRAWDRDGNGEIEAEAGEDSWSE